MSKTKVGTKEKSTNYSFALKCLGVVTLAALAAASVAAALSTKSAAVVGPVLTSKAALGTAVVVSTPMSPLAALLLIGAVCCLTLVLCRSTGCSRGQSFGHRPAYNHSLFGPRLPSHASYPTPPQSGGFGLRHSHEQRSPGHGAHTTHHHQGQGGLVAPVR